MRIVQSAAAAADLLAIWMEIGRHRPASADRVLDEIQDACRRLAKTPELGRSREELAPGLRSLPVRRYALFYRVSAGRLEIARILHGALDLDLLF